MAHSNFINVETEHYIKPVLKTLPSIDQLYNDFCSYRYVRSRSAIHPTSDHIRNYMLVVHGPILVHTVHCHSTTTLSSSITCVYTQEKDLSNVASVPNRSVFELSYELMREAMPLQLVQNSQHPCNNKGWRM